MEQDKDHKKNTGTKIVPRNNNWNLHRNRTGNENDNTLDIVAKKPIAHDFGELARGGVAKVFCYDMECIPYAY